MQNFGLSDLSDIFISRDSKRRRISSYDRSGANDDRYHVKPGQTMTFGEIDGCGIVNHIWITLMNDAVIQDPYTLRKVTLRIYWDDETTPSVEAPIGDFFGLGHAKSKNFVSAPLQMSPEDGKGFNSWWPMPFYKNAKFAVTNECASDLLFYFYVDYEAREELPEGALRFHAKFARCCPTSGIAQATCKTQQEWCFGRENLTGKSNYVILDAVGKGHYCGCNVNIHNLNTTNLWDWPGEGDDMIFIDGDTRPTLHGTGTEDYVNMAWCPTQEYCAPYHGLLLGGDENWKGLISYYRYHIQDPITFERDIRVTVEHGHDNHRSDDYSTTAYWYQTEPHKPFEPFLTVEQRMPVDSHHLRWTGEIRLVGID